VEHKREFSTNNYTLAIVAYDKWGRNLKIPPSISVAAVIRLEETGLKAEIYNEVRNALIGIEIQARNPSGKI
jgi:hypothetical protein